MTLNWINEADWLFELDIPPAGGQPDMAAGGPPMTQPGGPQDPMGTGDQQLDPNAMSTDPQAGEEDLEDISDDPEFPEMPEEKPEDDFEIWKIKYVKESIKGDPNTLVQMIVDMRDRELDPYQRKFIEDNLDVCFLRQNASIFQASRDIRKMIKQEFDRTNPATSVVQHITATIEQNPSLNDIYIKMSGLHGGKGDMHRKLVSAFIGGVQVGVGGANEDIIFEEKDYSIRISTRFHAKWGDINIGRWSLKEDDPERYLKEAELQRLEGGSPEEKDVLRRRVIIESIAEMFEERAFIMNVVGTDGTVYHLGWDLGTSLKSAFLTGKLIVRSKNNDSKEAFIDEEGSIIPIPNIGIYYIKESQSLDTAGEPVVEELEFLDHRDGMLFLSANLDLIKEASISLQGMILKETPWQGNPTDLLRVSRCIPSAPEMILRNC